MRRQPENIGACNNYEAGRSTYRSTEATKSDSKGETTAKNETAPEESVNILINDEDELQSSKFDIDKFEKLAATIGCPLDR